LKLGIGITLAILLLGCPPTPSPPPVDADATPILLTDASSSVTVACSKLQAFGCPEGEPTCPSALQAALDEHVSKKISTRAIACVANATSKVEIEECGASWCSAASFSNP
jgi:hypothetical protein